MQLLFPKDTLHNNIFIKVQLHFNFKKMFPLNTEDVRLEFGSCSGPQILLNRQIIGSFCHIFYSFLIRMLAFV